MVHCSHMCLFITRHFVWHIPGIHTTMPKSGSYFICRVPLVKKWSVSFNHISRSKVKAIGNSVKFLSGAYILSLWPNRAIHYPESTCWKILCNYFKPRFYVKSLGKNISLNYYIFSFELQLLSYTCTSFIECLWVKDVQWPWYIFQNN